jgi:transcriptional regulator with XRE-family HTH domain
MSTSTNTTAKQIWKKLSDKEYRDSFSGSHISNTVASQIFALREARGWTQKELAQRAGMSQSRISALEDPNYENYEVGTLKRIASAFDVAVTVRFVPFSELTTWTAELSTEKIVVADFTRDHLPSTPVMTTQEIAPNLDVSSFVGGYLIRTNDLIKNPVLNRPIRSGNLRVTGSLKDMQTTTFGGRYDRPQTATRNLIEVESE